MIISSIAIVFVFVLVLAVALCKIFFFVVRQVNPFHPRRCC